MNCSAYLPQGFDNKDREWQAVFTRTVGYAVPLMLPVLLNKHQPERFDPGRKKVVIGDNLTQGV